MRGQGRASTDDTCALGDSHLHPGQPTSLSPVTTATARDVPPQVTVTPTYQEARPRDSPWAGRG